VGAAALAGKEASPEGGKGGKVLPAEEDRAVMTEPEGNKSEDSDALVAAGAAWASAVGGAIGDAVATGGYGVWQHGSKEAIPEGN
jgi:hypothetical protein